MLLRSSGCLLLVLATAASGAEWEPKISVGIVDTDNLTLQRVNPEKATVYTLTPEISVEQDSRRVQADATYRADAYHYDERGEDEVYNQFDGELELSLVPEKFMFDMGASRTQAILDPESTIPIDNLVITSNRVDRDDYYAGPSFNVGAGGNAVVSGEIRRTWVGYGKTDGDVLEDYIYDRALLSVDNYAKGAGLAWAARYNYDNTEYEIGVLPYQYRSLAMELGFWASNGMRLFVIGGKETPWEQPLVTSLEDSFWEAGFARQVGEDLRTTLAVGDHSFGSSVRAEIDYTIGRGHMLLTYSETPTVNTNHRYQLGGLLDDTLPTDGLYDPAAIERYISNAFRFLLELELQRTNVRFQVYDESRESRTDLSGGSLEDEWQRGGDVEVSRQFGRRTQIYLRATRAESEFGSGEELELFSSALGASYALGRRTELALELEQREQRLVQADELDYEVTLISLTLSRSFN